MKNHFVKVISFVLMITLCAFLFFACGTTSSNTSNLIVNNIIPEENETGEDPAVAVLSAEQKSSMAMLNYLAYVVQDINSARHSRTALETAFDGLLNDVEPSGVDDATREAFKNIFEAIKKYRMNSFEYERLAFLTDQDSASSILSIIPNPLEVLETFEEKGPLPALAGLAYSTLDTVTESSYVSAEELLYLERKWDLEDAEEEALMDSRTDMFDYMVQIAQGLPKGITLSENDISEFVTQTSKSNGAAKLDWLKKNQEKYQYFGYYWLELADCCYENKDYEGCITAIAIYQANDTGIFKLDKRLAQSLQYAILSAKEIMSDSKLETTMSDFIDTIIANIGTEDWELRYYAAMAYMDLYENTGNEKYLRSAYEEIKNNVRNRVPVQKEQNSLYINDVVEIRTGDNTNKEDTSVIKAYNKYLKDNRKTELPPVYEPLLRNCELLFALAEKLDIDENEKNIIDSMLHDEPVFLSYEMDKKFSYNRTSGIPEISDESVGYSGVLADQKLTIPAVFAPAGTTITAVLNSGGQDFDLDNWSVYEVDRNKSYDIGDFQAVFSCKAPKTIIFKEGDSVTLKIAPPGAITEDNIVTIKLVVDKANILGVHFKLEP